MNNFLKKIELYDQTNAEYEFLGLVEHKSSFGGDYYRTIMRNSKNNLFYSFDDSHVQTIMPRQIQDAQAYILFYQLKMP